MTRTWASALLSASLALGGLFVLLGVVGLAGCAGAPRRVATAPPLAPAQAAHIVLTAMAFLDTPYRHGGNGVGAGGAGGQGADGFDCSGFTRHVYERSLGLALPRAAWDQARAPAFVEVGAADLQPGDLIFFNTLQKAYSHVGIYVGQGRFIHAPRQGTSVRIEEMQGAAGRYWTQRFDGARRAIVAVPVAVP
ncbi:MAG: C40 family peptidase [Burkholderiales bacterium]|nr:C40 family peptidase [Burkholderiales bacterium]